MLQKFKSRKFILAIIGALIAIVNAVLDAVGGPAINTEAVLTILGPIIAYILGEAYADGANRR